MVAGLAADLCLSHGIRTCPPRMPRESGCSNAPLTRLCRTLGVLGALGAAGGMPSRANVSPDDVLSFARTEPVSPAAFCIGHFSPDQGLICSPTMCTVRGSDPVQLVQTPQLSWPEQGVDSISDPSLEMIDDAASLVARNSEWEEQKDYRRPVTFLHCRIRNGYEQGGGLHALEWFLHFVAPSVQRSRSSTNNPLMGVCDDSSVGAPSQSQAGSYLGSVHDARPA